jgi:uncharacterized Tic20 family protein
MTEQTEPTYTGVNPEPAQIPSDDWNTKKPAAPLDDAPPTPSSDDQAWAAVAHGTALVTVLFGALTGGALCLVGPLVPLVIWLVFRERSKFVARHALQATVFQAAVVVATALLGVLGLVLVVAAWVATAALTTALVGFCLIPIALLLTLLWVILIFGLPVAALVYAGYAAYEVAQGSNFRYWLVGNWVD